MQYIVLKNCMNIKNIMYLKDNQLYIKIVFQSLHMMYNT